MECVFRRKTGYLTTSSAIGSSTISLPHVQASRSACTTEPAIGRAQATFPGRNTREPTWWAIPTVGRVLQGQTALRLVLSAALTASLTSALLPFLPNIPSGIVDAMHFGRLRSGTLTSPLP